MAQIPINQNRTAGARLGVARAEGTRVGGRVVAGAPSVYRGAVLVVPMPGGLSALVRAPNITLHTYEEEGE